MKPVRTLEHDAARGRGDVGSAAGVPLTVHVPPGDHGVERKSDRTAGQQPVHDAEARPAGGHRELPLDHHVADAPSPSGQTVVEVEGLQQLVATRCDSTGRPLVRGKRDLGAGGQRHDRVEAREAEASVRRRVAGHHQQAVIAARTQAADRTHGVAARAVGDEPFPRRSGREIAGDLTAEADRDHGASGVREPSDCRWKSPAKVSAA